MNSVESIIVTGGSGTGKTTLVNGLRIPEYSDRIVIPHRYATRPVRPDDNPEHTTAVGKEDMLVRITNGEVYPYWNRSFSKDRTEYYAFDVIDSSDGRLPVYPVTNPFSVAAFDHILKSSLVVSLNAFPTIRLGRIFEREFDPEAMTPSEIQARILDSEGYTLPQSAVRIDTSELTPEQGQARLRAIVDEVLAERKT